MSKTPHEYNSILSPMADIGESLPTHISTHSTDSLRTSLPVRLTANSIDDIMQGLDTQIYNSEERETIFRALRKFNNTSVKRAEKESTTRSVKSMTTPVSTKTTTTKLLPTHKSLDTNNNKQEVLLQLVDMVCMPNKNDSEYRCGRDYIASYKLGEGAFGSVRQCEDISTEKVFAQKLIHTAKYKADELAIQAKLTQDIQYRIAETGELSCGVVLALGAIRQDDMVYLFMEIMEDGSLGDMLRNAQGTMSLGYIVWYFHQILEGLSFIHSRRIIHLDIKADNILIKNEDFMKIADFGLARQIPEMKDAVYDGFFGTPHFMAPEVIRHELISTKSDVWAVGGVLYELITHKAPWTGIDVATIVFTVGKENVDYINSHTRPRKAKLEELSDDFHEEYKFNCDALSKLLTIFDMCFKLEFRKRASIDEILESEALNTLFSIIGIDDDDDETQNENEEIVTEDEVIDSEIKDEIERPFSKLPEFSNQITSLNAMRP